jgi:hypothetical protein
MAAYDTRTSTKIILLPSGYVLGFLQAVELEDLFIYLVYPFLFHTLSRGGSFGICLNVMQDI